MRAIAEETALSSARYVRALYNLDCSLGSSSAGPRSLLLAAKSRADRPRSRSPPDNRPPLRRSQSVRERPKETLRLEEAGGRPEEEDSYTEESGEEEEPVRDEVKKEDEANREPRRSERPPEPPLPPRKEEERKSGKTSKKKRKGKGHRGGSKHQRHYRGAEDPFRRSHRRLDNNRLELAGSLRSGLERRA